MARRSTKAEGKLVALAMIIGIPVVVISKIFESTGWQIPVFVIVGVIILMVLHSNSKKKARLAFLREKYGDESIVQKIFDGYFWEGQTVEQLLDSLGSPEAVDNKRLKTKVKEVWKYNHQGANRYSLRITVENGYIVGWDQKA